MKASTIACAVLASTVGFSTLASAQDGRRDRDQDRRGEARHEQRAEQRQDQRREARRDQRQDQRRDARQDQRRDDRAQHAQRFYSQPHAYQQPSYGHRHPGYAYQAPRHYDNARFYRGGTLPYAYRQQHYYVNDWRAHHGLYAPPYGHQWVQVGPDFALVALATGLIANLLTQ